MPHAYDCWTWELRTLGDLPGVRAAVRRHLADDDVRPTPPDSEAAERLVLALDELASNGLRHGRLPVGLRVCPLPDHWLVDVMDAAVGAPPSPDPGRPAGQGGYGLFVIAAYATGYGWVAEHECKHVWALLPRVVVR
ncbi:ATP-binding protein [Geodermatophilus ruber]|uniref:Histidine kinase-like ATPase domain-containing protein n=1 Tax=Geodermatophilus ruber TaxID=504800 RepID=A0A1I4C5H5_9ACTN|nr:ATP-binding protein [Geodermatophilus ruber]SFK75416.1 Histidine kinase-like ATPase domain-containing protein [Geodermatophilus ruber]